MDGARLLRILDRAERYGFIGALERGWVLDEFSKNPNAELRHLLMDVARLSPEQYAKSLDDPPSSAKKSSPLKTLGKYVLSQLLGRGGTSAVYKAWDESLKRWVAVKVLNPGGHAPERTILERFFREARLISRMAHPNIVPIYEVGEDNGIYFIAIKLIEGITAHEMTPTLAPRRAAEIVRDTALALHHAHQNEIIHRDMKPANIMLEGQHVWVLDFGVSKDLFADARQLTRQGMTLGTPHFMSPEQAQGLTIDKRTDVYALGATLYALVTRGGTPFEGDTLATIMDRVVHEDPIHPRARRPDLDPALGAIIVRCLEKNPAARYATAADLASDLDGWLQGRAPAPRPARPRVRRPSPALLAGLAIGLVIAGSTALIVTRDASRDRPVSRPPVPVPSTRAPLPPPPSQTRERGEAKLAEARKALDEGRLAHAIAAAREARAALGEDARPLILEATALRLRADLPGAIGNLTHALELAPGNRDALFQRGLGYLRRWEAEAGFLTPFLQQHGPIDVGPSGELIEEAALWREHAIADLRAIDGESLPPGDRAMRDGSLALLEGRGEDAMSAFASAPDHAEAMLWRARLAQLAGAHDEAVRGLDPYLERMPEDAHAWVIRAISRLQQKEYGDAETSCKRAAEIDKHCVHAHYVQGLVHHAQAYRQHEEDSTHFRPALEAYTRAIEADPDFPLTYLTRSLLLTHGQQLQKALDDLTVFIAKKPKASIGYNRRATIYIRQNDRQRAIDDYTTAVRLNPRYYYGYTNRAGIYMELAQWEQAASDWSSALSIQPDDARSLANRGVCRFHLSRFGDAVQDFERAIKIAPDLARQLREMLDEARRKSREN
jgi:serine/threonine protein kinase/Tfp pilus assembly protein PilF